MAQALYGSSPLRCESPYHAFAQAPCCRLQKPKQWPGPSGFASLARLLYDDQALYVCWELPFPAKQPMKLLEALPLEPPLASLPLEKQQLLVDERVECFLWQPLGRARPMSLLLSVGDLSETYYAFEINFAGEAGR